MTLNNLYSALVESSKAGEPLLTVREIAVMIRLRNALSQSTGQIAHAVALPKSAVTRALDGLERDRLVIRNLSDRDMRVNSVRLSTAGLAYLQRLERRLAPAKTKAAA